MGNAPDLGTRDDREALRSAPPVDGQPSVEECDPDDRGPDSEAPSRRPRCDWRVRLGYIAVGALCALIAIERGSRKLESWVVNHARYRFDARRLFLDERPAWADATILRDARRSAARLNGRSILEPTFDRELRSALADVPWIREVRRIAFGARGVAADVTLRVPVAWLAMDDVPDDGIDVDGIQVDDADGARRGRPAVYVDRHGHLLPFAGRQLRLPGIRSRHASISVAELRVAAREAHEVAQALRRKARASERAKRMWRSWLGVEVHREVRGDGETNTLLTLAFQSATGDVCPVRWGRGQRNARSGDQPLERKVAHLERIFYHHPGWRRIERGNVAFHDPVVVPRDVPGDGVLVNAE